MGTNTVCPSVIHKVSLPGMTKTRFLLAIHTCILLLLSKAQRFLHRGGELTVQGVVGFVGREVETVETRRQRKRHHVSKDCNPDDHRTRENGVYEPSMTLRQRVDLARLLDGKPPRSITALQILEPVHRDPTRSGGKLQQSALLLGIPGPDHLPEILDHLVLLLVAAVIGVFLPVVDIDVSDAADQEFELALIEDVDQVGGDELVEAGDEGVELFRDALLDLPFCYQSTSTIIVSAAVVCKTGDWNNG